MNYEADGLKNLMYRYTHFKPEYYDFSKFRGPAAGEQAVNFTATDLDGKQVRLSDFSGKWIVFETGSTTCPITQSKIKQMERLAKEFADVVFILLYTREAHPGEKIGQHTSFEDKSRQAEQFRNENKIERIILVDDLEGSVHQKYGSMPNSVYIINPGGIVVFRGNWNNLNMARRVLEERDSDKLYNKEHWSARPYFGKESRGMFDALYLAGWQAIWDFVKAFPQMVIKHMTKPR